MYQVLYRKWRPQVFEDVSGQPHVTVTLKNELQSGRINHAYLFTGSRGTGKTTCAKILAKAINCLDSVHGDPCCQCEICKGIDEGTILDVSEIDAASNNGVDNIRSIIDEAAFTPTKAKYRVYIIDEVHMLSSGAFNALLKTLEEPPPHVVFILATTEVHKLPATILSRCQRFDFHRIPADDMAQRLEYVAAQEQVTIDHDAALLIAAVSDGALRDALSLMDRCMGIENHITADLVRRTAGLAGRDHLFRLTDYIKNQESGKALDLIEALHKESKDMARLCEEFTEHFRNLMLLKTMKSPQTLIILSAEEYEQAQQQSNAFSLETILHAMDTLQAAYDRMFRGGNKRIEMEVAIIKLSSPQVDESNNAILSRLAKLERFVKNNANGPVQPAGAVETETRQPVQSEVTTAPAQPIQHTGTEPVQHTVTAEPVSQTVKEAPVQAPVTEPGKQAVRTEPAKPVQKKEETEPVNQPAPQVDFDTIVRNAVPMEDWTDVLDILKNYSQTIAASFKDTDAYISGDYLLIDAKSDIPFRLLRQSAQRDKMRVAVKEVTGRTYKLGPYKKAEEEEKKVDPLIGFAEKVKEAGIPITEISNED